MHQHVRRLDADPDDPGQQAEHGVPPGRGLPLQRLEAGLLDLPDLVAHEPQPRHVAAQLGERVRRQRPALGRAHRLQALRRVPQGRLEAADAQAGPGRALIRFTIRVRSPTRPSRSRFGRLASSSSSVGTAAMLQWPGSPRSHPRKARLSSSVSSRSVLARRCSRETATLVGWMTCASTPRAAQPAGQPEAVPAGLEGDRDPRDRAAGPDRLVPPAMQQPQAARSSSGASFLQRVPLEARNDPGHEPARLAHLDDGDQRAMLLQGDEGPAQVVPLRHGALRACFQRRWCLILAARPIASAPGRGRRHRPDRGRGADHDEADDGSRVGPLLDQVEGPVASLTGDGAYDREDVYGAVAERHPEAAVIVPPRGTRCRARRPRPRRRSATATSGSSPSAAAWAGRKRPGTIVGLWPRRRSPATSG